MSDYWLLKIKRVKEATTNAFVSNKSNWCSTLSRAESSIIIRHKFKPSVSEGFVSLDI